MSSAKGAGQRFLFLAALLVCFCSREARADRPAGVTAQTLVLPQGPASLKGLGESFEPNAAMGTGGYSVPLQVPPGFLAPSPVLSYSGGQGKGVLGQGWNLSTLQIYRQTDKGSPNFDEDDRFAVSGDGLNDELVRVNEKLHYYRLKNDGTSTLFIRDPAGDSWTVRLGSGSTSYLGTDSESREVSRGRSARWFVAKQADRFGHWTEFRYSTERGHVYLSEIAYQLHAASAYQNRVAFEYEDRPDVFTDYTYGDADTTARRLQSVAMFHGARLVRTYRLSYRSGLLFSLLTNVELTGENGLKMPKLSFDYLADGADGGELVTVKNPPPLDALAEGWGELEDVNADGLPDLLASRPGDYRYYENIDGRSFGSARTVNNSPDHDLTEAGVVFADLNGDGFRDLVHAQGDHFRYYPGGNVRNGVFLGYGDAVELQSRSDGFSFTSAELKLGDQNRDGRIDLLWQKPGNDSWLINGADNVLREQLTEELPLDVDFTDPRVELTDFNGDSLLDFVRKDIGLDSSVVRVWFGLGHGEFAPEVQIPGAPKGDPSEFHLRDVNRDGQSDLLRISGSWATVYINRGSLGFSAARGDFLGLPAANETLKLLFSDMNGNGTTDIVWVTSDFKLRYLELSGEPHAGLLSRVDNGMGMVTDVAYRSSTEYLIEAKAAGQPWVYPLPVPTAVISEVRSTDSLDALGFAATESRTSFQYRDGYYDGKEHEFRGFADSSVTSWGDANHETLVTRSKLHVGRNPITFADEEVLKGKALSVIQTDGNGNVFASTEAQWEPRWLCQEAIGGEIDILPRCKELGDLAGKKDQLVALAVSPLSLTASLERTARPRFASVATEFDAWGEATRVTNYGEVTYAGAYQPGDPLDAARISDVPGDEQVTVHKALHDVSEWLIGLPTEEQLQDRNGTVFGKRRTYYDNLAFGKAKFGLETRAAEYDADKKRWVDNEITEYDSHGNEIATQNAVADRTELRYDTATHFFPDRERDLVGDNDWVTFEAEYDYAHGEITRETDANGLERRVELDGLGRVVRTFEPGQPLPATRYEYTFGTPTAPVSVTRIDELIEASGRYHSAWSYSDGSGRLRQRKESAEQPYGYIASGWVDLSPRAGATAKYEPFSSQTLGLEAPPKSAPVVRLTLDALGRPLQAIAPPTPDLPRGSLSRSEYYPWENRAYTEKESSLGDGLGRVIEAHKLNVSHGEEQELVWKIGYDPRGLITTFADPLWNGKATDTRHLRHYDYDALGRLKAVHDPNAGQTLYEHDDLDRIVKFTNALGQSQTWNYGAAGRLISHTVSADGHGNAAYDHRYHYDVAAPNSPLDAPNAAHLRGRLSWVEFPTGEEHYGYDDQGHLAEEAHRLWNPSTSSFEQQTRDVFRRKFTFRADGLPTRKVAPGGLELTYGYNERGSLTRLDGKLGANNRTILSDARYNHRGTVASSDFGNGIRTCSSFNERGEVTAMATAKIPQLDCAGAATVLGGLSNLRYTRSYDGLITAIEDRSNPATGVDRLDADYEYDAIQQLVKVTDPRGSRVFSYDKTQNLVSREIIGDIHDEPTGEFGYGEGGAGPNAVTTADGKSYAYDAAGQMLRYNDYDLRFNVEGQLVEAHNITTGVRIVQHYDDDGERRLSLVYRQGKPVEVHRFVTDEYEIRDGEEVWFASAGLARAEVVRSKGVKVDAYLLDQLTKYVNGEDVPKPLPAEYMDLNNDGVAMNAADLALAQQSFTNETRVGGEKLVWRFTTTDHLGSASKVTDSAGDVVSFQRFHAYGKVATTAGQRAYRSGYLGKDTEVDLDLGLQRIGARYYAAALGRWISADPLIGRNPAMMVASPLESNLYSYGRNNPIMVRDPLGLQGKQEGSFWRGVGNVVMAKAQSIAKAPAAVAAAIKDIGEAGGDFAYGVVHDDPAAVIRGGEKLLPVLQHFTVEGQVDTAIAAGADVANSAIDFGYHAAGAIDSYQKGDMTAAGEHTANAVGNGLKVAAVVVPLAKAARGLAAAELAEGAEAASAAGRCGRACAPGSKTCFAAGTAIVTAGGEVAIEDIRPGNRVLSLGGSEERTGVDPATWRLVRLWMLEPNGSGLGVELELLRPLQWIEDVGARSGGSIQLEIGELKLRGAARVVAIEPCSPIPSGPGEVVTGTITRIAHSLLRVSFEQRDGRSEVLEPTDNHPFYSHDRDGWVTAGDLEVNELVSTQSGTARVVAVERKPGSYRVYNLEIDDAHSYLVGHSGVWVHNAYGNKTLSGPTDRRVPLRKQTLEDIRKAQPRNQAGKMVDPNTRKQLKPDRIDVGHKKGQEWRRRKKMHEQKGSTRAEVIEAENNSKLYQLEDRSSNRSHKNEKK